MFLLLFFFIGLQIWDHRPCLQIHRQMELDGEPISAQKIVDEYPGRDDKPVIMLMNIFGEHNEKCRKLSGNVMARGTVERYERS